MHLTEQLSPLEAPRYSNDPQQMRHYWYAFLLTEEFAGPCDDWNTYCMGTEL